jgi:hypothetical protein
METMTAKQNLEERAAQEVFMRDLPPPSSAAELALEDNQRRVTLGNKADVERKALILELYEGGMSQREIAARLTRASLAAGGLEITENSVFKLLSKMRGRTPDAIRRGDD